MGLLNGEHRLRMLFGVPKGVRAVKFACVVTYFGRVELPPPHPTTPAPLGPREPRPGKVKLPWDG